MSTAQVIEYSPGWWRDRSHPTTRWFCAQIRRRVPHRQIADQLGISRERVRQLVEEIQARFGKRMCTPILLYVSEAASQTGYSWDKIEHLIRLGRLKTYTGNTWTVHSLLTRREIKRLTKTGLYVSCPYCMERIPTKRVWEKRKHCGKAKCRKKYDQIRRRYRYEDFSQLRASSWRAHFLVVKDKELPALPRNETWLTHRAAYALTGLTWAEFNWITVRKLLRTKKHPFRTWHGRPVRMYPKSELDLVKRVHDEWIASSKR